MKYQYKREPLSVEEIDRLINACTQPLESLIVITLLDTGIRLAELCKLTKDSVLWQEERLIVYGKGGKEGKNSKRRVIPLTNRVKRLLEAWFIINGQNSLSLYPMKVQRIVRNLANKAGITRKCHPHVLRHTFAVKCLENSMDIKIIKELLGHESILTTENYLNLGIERIDKIFREKWQA